LDEIVWLITLLCNQPILVHNLKHPEDKKPELTADEVELLTSPMELTDYKDAIMEAMYRGTKRNVESEPEGKNTAAGKEHTSELQSRFELVCRLLLEKKKESSCYRRGGKRCSD